MKKADLVPGQWYTANTKELYKEFYFLFYGLKSDNISIKVDKIRVRSSRVEYLPDSHISNKDYYKNATPIDFESIKHLLPQKKEETLTFSIFN